MPRGKGAKSGGNLGIFDIPNLDDIENVSDDDTDDPDLEAELMQLQGGKAPKPRKKPSKASLPVNPDDLNAMIAASLRDVPSDEDLSDVENDPDLMAELTDLNGGEVGDEEVADDGENDVSEEPVEPQKPARTAPPPPAAANMVKILEERLAMYVEAENAAKATGQTSKARRCNRGVKTLEKLVKDARAGRKIAEDDIPPPIHVSGQKPNQEGDTQLVDSGVTNIPGQATEGESGPVTEDPKPPESEQPAEKSSNVDPARAKDRELIVGRQLEYKKAALQCKKDGDKEKALLYIRVVKDLDVALQAFDQGQILDLSQMPGPPGQDTPQVEENDTQKSSDPVPIAPEPQAPAPPAASEVVTVPTTILGVLEQRLSKYKDEEQKAKDGGNSSKARRMGRIVKQFADAIKTHKAGRNIVLDELPCPPGYPPFPGQAGPPELKIPVIDAAGDEPSEPTPAMKTPVAPPAPAKPSKNSEQLSELLRRQQEFKEAAVKAKKDGDVEKAREYLKCFKGFAPLIEASKGGLPVDLSTLPISPLLKEKDADESFEIINSGEMMAGDMAETYEALQKDLEKQIEMCQETSSHFKAVGDIGSSNKFEQLRLNCRKDLRTLLMAKERGDVVPKFHYEFRTYSVVVCCPDLNDNDFELGILSGINFNVSNPDDIDTYVKYFFPYPADDGQKGKTALVKDTNDPKYNETFKLNFDRKSRSIGRLFRSKSLKLEVWARGYTMGIFRSDTIVGTVQIKLQPLEKQCLIHEAFDMMDGRKKVGKLEVKCRIRNAILGPQISQVKKKWLVIDGV